MFETVYEFQEQQVSCRGVGIKDGDEFKSFMAGDVVSRLYDNEGTNEFASHLRDVVTTGFETSSLEAVLKANVSENRDWAIGEAIAEAYLARIFTITWPWNMERDKRNPSASLAGADLIGFLPEGDQIRLVFGEVKSSSELAYPPQVMNTNEGHMGNQIDKLANDLGLINKLLRWLLCRCKGSVHEQLFNAAVRLFFASGNKNIALFGVLVRDTSPNSLDLQARGNSLARKLQAPTNCRLIALYLPCKITTLPKLVPGDSTL